MLGDGGVRSAPTWPPTDAATEAHLLVQREADQAEAVTNQQLHILQHIAAAVVAASVARAAAAAAAAAAAGPAALLFAGFAAAAAGSAVIAALPATDAPRQ